MIMLLKKKEEIPKEIDDHFKLFGKEPWEVEYGEKCTICNVRIDEYGFCSCGSSGDRGTTWLPSTGGSG